MKIVIGFDGSPSARHALETAIELFRSSSPEVVLLGVIAPPTTSAPLKDTPYRTTLEEARQDLKEAAEQIGEAGLSGEIRFVEGDPRQVLAEITEKEQPTIVVVGARGTTAIESILLGSVSTYAVKHLPVPVLVVPHPESR